MPPSGAARRPHAGRGGRALQAVADVAKDKALSPTARRGPGPQNVNETFSQMTRPS